MKINKKAFIVPLIFSALFALSCASSDEKTTLTISLGGTGVSDAFGGVIEPAAYSGTSSVPADVYDLEIQILENGKTITSKVFDRSEIDSSDTVTIEVPSGVGRTVVANGRNSQGFVMYKAQADGIDMQGSATDVNLYMNSTVALSQDATFAVNFVDENGAELVNKAYYLNTTITVKLYKPAMNSNGYLGSEISSSSATIASPTSGNLTAYPHSYQIALAYILTDDNAFAVVGGAVISNLNSGANSPVTIKMHRPCPLVIKSSSAPSSTWAVEVSVDNGASYTAVESGTASTWTSTKVVSVPNCVNSFGKQSDGTSFPAVANRYVQVRFDGAVVSEPTVFSSGTNPLRWSEQLISF